MKPEDFLEYTPQELSAILFYNAEEQQERVKIEWEKTRIQTFFLLSVHIPKKHSFNIEKILFVNFPKLEGSVNTVV